MEQSKASIFEIRMCLRFLANCAREQAAGVEYEVEVLKNAISELEALREPRE